MRPMSAGEGYKYLLRSVAAGDGERSLRMPLTRYYAKTGTPPGHWLGSGVVDLGVFEESEVTERQLELLLGQGRHPRTGEQLGRAYPVYAKGTGRTAVAGFDFTFSVPKSASILWAVADAATQEKIAAAHHAAIRDVLAFMEREVAATRVGASVPGGGAVAQADVTGLIATAYDHFDSRAGDPHLHTHVVVSNKVKGAVDGRWRSLDSRPLHGWTVALSELHQAVFADHLTRTLGVGWEPRSRGQDRHPDWSVAGVPSSLIKLFSTRAGQVDRATDELITAYIADHGRRPGRATLNRLRNQASLATRPDKQVRPLSVLTAGWRRRTTAHLGIDATTWAAKVTAGWTVRLWRSGDLSAGDIEHLAHGVLGAVAEKRSTWRRANLYAEAARELMGLRFATMAERETATEMVVARAVRASLRLTPPEMASSPREFRRPDGSTRLRPKDSTRYTSTEILAAEKRLLRRAETPSAPTVAVHVVTSTLARGTRSLSPDQSRAVAAIATSTRQLDLLIGPAGAGKTTAMRALRTAWSRVYGRGSVVGLAPSAAAAQVLADDLGIRCENTAKWLVDHRAGRTRLRRGQLVIIDEASLAGTLTLDAITAHAAAAGAKVLLVGDTAQLQAVEAGGAFALLAGSRDDVAQLVEIHRFTHGWERDASRRLRDGDPSVLDDYLSHKRIHADAEDDATENAYDAWLADVRAGIASVLVAPSGSVVDELNTRARADRIRAGEVDPARPVDLARGTTASKGDVVITRRNDRTLRTTGRGRHSRRTGWVRNGERWTVLDVRRDGAMVVTAAGRRAGRVVLPAPYVADHVDLGYAITAHRAQGITVDTAHVLVGPGVTREAFYVAMTRGRHANHAYVALDKADELHAYPPDPADPWTGRDVLASVLATTGAEPSATETIWTEQTRWASIGQLAAEYDTIATAAQRPRWRRLLRAHLDTATAEQAIASEAFGPLAAELRRLDATGHDPDRALAQAVARGDLTTVDDAAAVLRHRLRLSRPPAQEARRGHLEADRVIAGLIPKALGDVDAEHGRALEERRKLIEQRAQTLAAQAVRATEPWTRALGPAPADRAGRARWRQTAITIAAYRDRYQITARAALGAEPNTDVQRLDRARAQAALTQINARAMVNDDPLGSAVRSEPARQERSTPERAGP